MVGGSCLKRNVSVNVALEASGVVRHSDVGLDDARGSIRLSVCCDVAKVFRSV